MCDNCKDTTMSIRLSTKEKNQIKKKAKSVGKTVSTYVTEAAVAGLERNSSKAKKYVTQMVQNQEKLNDIYRNMRETDNPDTNGLYAKIVELVEGENRLWECLCR